MFACVVEERTIQDGWENPHVSVSVLLQLAERRAFFIPLQANVHHCCLVLLCTRGGTAGIGLREGVACLEVQIYLPTFSPSWILAWSCVFLQGLQSPNPRFSECCYKVPVTITYTFYSPHSFPWVSKLLVWHNVQTGKAKQCRNR